MKNLKIKPKLPYFFKPLFWWSNFYSINPKVDEKEVIVQTINYGGLDHWRWIRKFYGLAKIQKAIKNIPASEFRKQALKLAKILFKAKDPKYASRSDFIKSLKNFQKS